MAQDKYARHGGVHFTQHVSNEQVNRFVQQLPSEKRDNLFEVLDELNNAGLITIQNDSIFADGNGSLQGTDVDLDDRGR